MYFVYLLRSINFPTCTYIGYTTNIQARLEKHNSGSTLHTSKYRPWKLHCYFAFGDKHRALKFERYLKSHAEIAFANKRFW